MNSTSQGSSPESGPGQTPPPPLAPQAKRTGVLAGVSAFVLALFGTMIWHPPGWVRSYAASARQRPREAVGMGLALGVVLLGFAYLATVRPPQPAVPYVKVNFAPLAPMR